MSAAKVGLKNEVLKSGADWNPLWDLDLLGYCQVLDMIVDRADKLWAIPAIERSPQEQCLIDLVNTWS